MKKLLFLALLAFLPSCGAFSDINEGAAKARDFLTKLAPQIEKLSEDAGGYVDVAKDAVDKVEEYAGLAQDKHQAALAASTQPDGSVDYMAYLLALLGGGGVLAGLKGERKRTQEEAVVTHARVDKAKDDQKGLEARVRGLELADARRKGQSDGKFQA